jgi:hypothetical protein
MLGCFLGVDDIVKLLSELQVNIDDQTKLKKIFFEMFTLKKVNAKMVDMKLDLNPTKTRNIDQALSKQRRSQVG